MFCIFIYIWQLTNERQLNNCQLRSELVFVDRKLDNQQSEIVSVFDC
jgi:hypothetical protein